MIETFRQRLRDAWAASDRIFDLIPRDRWLDQPIRLRHPILFYIGHLPAFAWNQVGRGLLDLGALHPTFDELFERGIDPVGSDRQAEAAIEWPGVDEVLAYRDRARERLLELVEDVAERADRDRLAAHGRILNVALEHEYMHQETLQYMFLELGPGTLERPADVAPARFDAPAADGTIEVAGGEARLGAAFDAIEFGWDNEFPEHRVRVERFRIDRVPVTIERWLDFVDAGGYRRPELWLDGDWRWRERVGLEHPPRWRRANGGWRYRTLFDDQALERVRGWPVMVSLAEARAFCRWSGSRLPTEAELHRAMYGSPGGTDRRYPWGDAEPEPGVQGNFGFSSWSPTPVGSYSAGASAWGLLDTVGNLWQWTSSPFAPFPGFEAYVQSYPGYSVDFFDDRHFVMLGASWATPTPLIRRSFRNWFQDRYPYAFAGFRTVHPG